MFAKNLPRLSGVIDLVKQCSMRIYLAVALLLVMVTFGLQFPTSSNTYTFIGNEVLQHDKSVASTGMIGNAPTPYRPGHDFGVIVDGSGLDKYQPATVLPVYYTLYNGTIIKRKFELGPLTGTISLTIHKPGHDLGVIGSDN